MKPIFLAGASLLAAGAAFGFAKAVDQLSQPAVSPVPANSASADRLAPDTELPPRPVGPEAAPPIPVAVIEDPRPATPLPSPQVARVSPSGSSGPAAADDGTFALLPTEDAGIPAGPYHFRDLPQIGVYR